MCATGGNTAAIGTYGNTGGWNIGSGGGSMTTYARGMQGYTGSPSVSYSTFGQQNYNRPGGSRSFMPGGPPGTAGSDPYGSGGFLSDLSFGEQYAFGAAGEAIAKGMQAFSKADFEQQSYEWKAEMYRRNAVLKQRQIDDMKKVGKQKEAALREKYKLLKYKYKPGGRKQTNILAGGGSALAELMGVDVLEAADLGLLRVNVQKDIYGAKVGKWSDDTSAKMYAHRAAQSSPLGDMATSMLSSAASSGMKYWQYKNSLPSTSSWT